ncbi:MAG TPA: nitroreductase family protein [Gaiellaceae bacterium]
MDAWLAIASKRDLRAYAQTPIPPEVERRILEAGRISGSSQNSQRWEFVVVESAKQALSGAVWAPHNVATAMLVIAIVGDAAGFDVGRTSQNMMLAAWNEGVASCPNGIRDHEAAARICGGDVKMIISFGYPAKPRDVDARSADEWSARAKRAPLDELVRRV